VLAHVSQDALTLVKRLGLSTATAFQEPAFTSQAQSPLLHHQPGAVGAGLVVGEDGACGFEFVVDLWHGDDVAVAGEHGGGAADGGGDLKDVEDDAGPGAAGRTMWVRMGPLGVSSVTCSSLMLIKAASGKRWVYGERC
jgi:hypothetical protein